MLRKKQGTERKKLKLNQIFKGMGKEYIESNKLTSEDFEIWIKEIFTNNNKPQKRWMIIDYATVVGLRKEMGDDWFYSFVKSVNIMCGEDTANYIENFVNEHENRSTKNILWP